MDCFIFQSILDQKQTVGKNIVKPMLQLQQQRNYLYKIKTSFKEIISFVLINFKKLPTFAVVFSLLQAHGQPDPAFICTHQNLIVANEQLEYKGTQN